MSYSDEILAEIFSEDTYNSVEAHFHSEDPIAPAGQNITARLLRTPAGIINFEILGSNRLGSFYVPVAAFHKDRSVQLVNNLEMKIRQENPTTKVNTFDYVIRGFNKEENAVIACSSAIVLDVALMEGEGYLTFNGYDIEIYKADENEFNVFLADKHGLDPRHAIMVFITRPGQMSINPTHPYRPYFDKIARMEFISSNNFFNQLLNLCTESTTVSL